ncbi:NaeI family type II restriction endonuclease [Streptomyces xanthochromogenes]|uniref:NaeI family type II restriction endonuclease n=1 Tax=Streptomyces xanthochromogenes TaxID=67384 RepID=UPI003429B17A
MTNDDALFSDQDVPGAIPARPHAGPAAGSLLPGVAEWFSRQSNLENRFSSALRQSIDEVLDGQRTGRYDVDDLEKTEKTYLGTKVEIVCRAEFGLGHGEKMDYRVSGVEVDSKFSLTGQWMIPREAMGHICLLMAADDKKSTFSSGLVEISEGILTRGGNQDGKRSISKSGRDSIRWLFRGSHLRENLILQLDPGTRNAIMSIAAGQGRVDELFRSVQGKVVDRNAVVTAGKQLDAPKRVRDSRKRLASEGVIILGHQNESPRIINSLELPAPSKGEWVSVRVVPARPGEDVPKFSSHGAEYRVAEPGDLMSPAPIIQY